MFNEKITSILQLIQSFPDEQSCIDHLEAIIWNGKAISPFDPTSKVWKCKGNNYQCKNTGKNFNVKTGTMFDNTKLPLQKWFLAIWIATSHKKGISSLQLGRDLDITQKSAWFMLQRIRACFNLDSTEKLSNIVEIDETYIGGDNVNKSNTKRLELHKDGFQTGSKHKTPVVGMLQREGNVKAMVVNLNKGETMNKKNLQPMLIENISGETIIITDGFGGYDGAGKLFAGHEIINHAKSIYVRGIFHTNGIEGYWSNLKRGLYGIYHSTSVKHLQKYVDEFVFRYNTRTITENDRFNLLLSNAGTRLTYKELTHG